MSEKEGWHILAVLVFVIGAVSQCWQLIVLCTVVAGLCVLVGQLGCDTNDDNQNDAG